MFLLDHDHGRDATAPRWLSELAVLFLAGSVDLLVWSGDNELRGGAGSAAGWLVPAGSLTMIAALLLRRRHPVAVLAVQMAWAGACALVFTAYTPVTALLVAVSAVGRKLPPSRSLAGWGACLLPFALQAGGAGTWLFETTYVVVFMLLAGAAWLIGHRARLARLQAAEQDAATEEAVHCERLRIARELHDGITHAVSVMMLQVAGARAVLTSEPGRAGEALDTVQDVGRQSMNDLRRLLGVLRTAGDGCEVTGAEPQPGLESVDTLLAGARGAGLTVSKRVSGVPGVLDPSVGLAAYRLVQEGLTNALKHAGPGATVRIDLDWTPEHVTVTVTDDGPPDGRRARGTAPSSPGFGLLGLRERVQIAGGVLRTGPAGDGFLLQAVLPAVVPAAALPERIAG